MATRTTALTRLGIIVVLSLVSPRTGGAGPVPEPQTREKPVSTALIDAVKNADRIAVRALLRQHVNVNGAEPDGTTALHWAAEQEDAEILDLLISAGANVRAGNRYGATPLTVACVNGNVSIVERLLAAGADPNTTVAEGDTALMTAARSGSAGAVRALLARGADVNAATRKGQTALMWSVAENNRAVAQILLEAGADLHAQSKGERGFTPFLFAVRAGSLEAARLLLAAGADVNEAFQIGPSKGMSAFVLAVLNAHYELAMFLLDHGADVNAAGQGWTALHQMTWMRKPNEGNNNPLPLARGSVDSLSFVKELLARGANPNVRMTKDAEKLYTGNNYLNRIGATPFMLAAFRLDLPMMRLLVANGADALIPNEDNATPLMAAAGVGFFTEGEVPYTAEEAIAGVKMCLDLGAVASTVDANGDTALHGAAFRGVDEVVRMLVAAGGRLDAENGLGWMPWRIAEGVADQFGLRRQLKSSALLRQLMKERGLWTEELEASFRGPSPAIPLAQGFKARKPAQQ